MTGTPQDKGLAEIKRLLERLEETSAAGPATPHRPTAGEPAKHTLPPPPPAKSLPSTVSAPPEPSGSRLPLVLSLAALAIATAAGLLAVSWPGGTVSLAEFVGQLAAGGARRPGSPASTVSAVRATDDGKPASSEPSAPPAPTATADGASGPPSVAAGSAVERRLAQAVSTPAVTPRSEPSPAARRDEAATPPKAVERSLRVTGIISVAAGARKRLSIAVDPPFGPGAGAIVLIRGLPAGAALSSGAGSDNAGWKVAATEAGDLTLAVPASATGRHQLELELRSSDGSLIASTRSILEIERPTTKAPMADSARAPEAALLEWLAESRRLIGEGHIARARLLLERAADNGLAEAARVLGDTYDPAKLYALGVRGMSGDIPKAIYWYERADELGDPQAKARLLALGGR